MLNSVLADIPALIAAYGYGLILVMVMLESLGLPLPGEATLITASIYAGATHDLTLIGIIAAAVLGAVTGDNIGFWIGETVGSRLLVRFGPRLGLTPAKIKLGQYLFMRHGGKVVWGDRSHLSDCAIGGQARTGAGAGKPLRQPIEGDQITGIEARRGSQSPRLLAFPGSSA